MTDEVAAENVLSRRGMDASRAQGLQAGNYNRQTNIFPVGRVAVARRAVFLPARRRVAGREELLDGLRQRLTALTSAEDGGPGVLALHGLGGVGKSSLALEYAHRHWATGDYGLVWWMNAAEPATIGTQLGALLAAQLEIPDAQELDPVAVAQAVLAARTDPWLLILDNAESPAAVREFLPPAGRGEVLITSRNPNWHPHARLEVPDLDPAAAAAFLIERAGDPDQVHAGELAEQLGYLPLGLEQAGAYISATPGASLAAYLKSYRKRRPELLGRGDPADYEHPIATTWSLALEALGPAAVGLLRLLACYAPDSIPLALLLPEDRPVQGLDPEPGRVLGELAEDELELDEALAVLYRYSLVRTGSGPTRGGGTGADAVEQGRLVSVHRLVQAVVLDQLSDQQRAGWAHAARSLLDQALPPDPEDPAGWPAFTLLLPHLLATHSDTDDALGRAGRFLYASGDYRSARRVQEQVVSARLQLLGQEHPDTLEAQHNLAGTLYSLGEWGEARRLLERVLQARLRVLGPEHPATLGTQTNLAFTLWHLGELGEARRVQERMLQALVRVLKSENPNALGAPGNLAGTLSSLGEWGEARRLLERVLQPQLRVLGSEQPATLTAQNNLAGTLADLGELAEARRLLEQVVQARLRVSGSEHPHTLTAQNNLAFVSAAEKA